MNPNGVLSTACLVVTKNLMQSFHAVHAFRKYVTKHASMKPEKVGMAGMQKKKKKELLGLMLGSSAVLKVQNKCQI